MGVVLFELDAGFHLYFKFTLCVCVHLSAHVWRNTKPTAWERKKWDRCSWDRPLAEPWFMIHFAVLVYYIWSPTCSKWCTIPWCRSARLLASHHGNIKGKFYTTSRCWCTAKIWSEHEQSFSLGSMRIWNVPPWGRLGESVCVALEGPTWSQMVQIDSEVTRAQLWSFVWLTY